MSTHVCTFSYTLPLNSEHFSNGLQIRLYYWRGSLEGVDVCRKLRYVYPNIFRRATVSEVRQQSV